ncbi:hypothetical protein MKW94_020678 [Papaver nudicaule]|uniref:PPIase cyclophilin-type domain-containing protein n=1 Tax=Papaver nudicaule TaxID=74823 RepID=A0AA41S6I3_PAPNU|nr:hypothetical protein [Papaver nudicaule]
MSTIYVVEPPTKGKVIVNTNYGPLDIELWPKEAPKATRNFVQLCLEGYYDNTIFHRIIKSFLVQGGDPTATGLGGESIYGKAFADEFHSRLRFKHRGLVACANAGTPHSNGSQFFMTLDRCDWIDKKNTIFGKVTGDSLFNLLNLADVETDKDDRPLDPPPKILSVEVLWNPFDDIVPRQLPGVQPSVHPADEAENKDQKKKAVKKLNLLSFGEEAEQEEKELAAVKVVIRSSHDVLDDPRLLKEATDKEVSVADAKRSRDVYLSVREALTSNKEESKKESEMSPSSSHGLSDDDESNFDARMRQQILKKRKDLGDIPRKKESVKERPSTKERQERKVSPPRASSEDDDDKPRVEKLALKKKGIGSEVRAERLAKADTDIQLLTSAEQSRHLVKQKKRRIKGREDEVLAKLEKFKKLKETQANEAKDEDLSDWRSHSLKCAPEKSTKSGMVRNDDPDQYVVVDPLLEKGKEKFNKMQAKQKRREREWNRQAPK